MISAFAVTRKRQVLVTVCLVPAPLNLDQLALGALGITLDERSSIPYDVLFLPRNFCR